MEYGQIKLYNVDIESKFVEKFEEGFGIKMNDLSCYAKGLFKTFTNKWGQKIDYIEHGRISTICLHPSGSTPEKFRITKKGLSEKLNIELTPIN